MGKKIDITTLIGYVAILVIIISLANIGVRLTGRVTDTGIVNVTIESRADIEFTTELINFGSGQVDAGQTSCILTTVGDGTKTTGNWTETGDNFVTIGAVVSTPLKNKSIWLPYPNDISSPPVPIETMSAETQLKHSKPISKIINLFIIFVK